MNFIEHIIEPKKLLLTWQSADKNYRLRKMIGNLERINDIVNLNYFYDSKDFQEAKKLGFTGYPAFPIQVAEQKQFRNVLGSFLKRIPPRSRQDFGKYLESIRLKADSEISDFALLGYSGARLPDDDFSIVNPFENAHPPFELLTVIQGFRYYNDALTLLSNKELVVGAAVTLEKEPDNKFDKEAVAVKFNSKKIGNIMRGLLPEMNKWITNNWIKSVTVERINGKEDNPQIYLFIVVR